MSFSEKEKMILEEAETTLNRVSHVTRMHTLTQTHTTREIIDQLQVSSAAFSVS